jgi:hypothetical protein
VLVTEALALGVAALQLAVFWTPDSVWILPATYIAGWLLFAFVLLFATLAADESCREGARPLLAYAIAFATALLGSSAAFGVMWQLIPSWFDPRWPFRWVRIASNGVDWAEFGGFGLAAYVNRQMANRILETVRAGQLRRVQLEQQLVASTLAATEAQVDPQALIRSLTAICAGLEHSDPGAPQRLDALIQSLRASLARTMAAEDSGPSPS